MTTYYGTCRKKVKGSAVAATALDRDGAVWDNLERDRDWLIMEREVFINTSL